jgi:hypothetical protein
VTNEGRRARHKWTHRWGSGSFRLLNMVVPRVVRDNNTILRSNTSNAHSPTHHDHMHASTPALILSNTHTTLVYPNDPTHSPGDIDGD